MSTFSQMSTRPHANVDIQTPKTETSVLAEREPIRNDPKMSLGFSKMDECYACMNMTIYQGIRPKTQEIENAIKKYMDYIALAIKSLQVFKLWP